MRRPKLDTFARAYVEAALWSSVDQNTEEPLNDNHDASDIDTKTLRQMVKDCIDFRRSNRRLLKESGLSVTQQGHDFWLTRNGHGAGFWDRGIGRVGDELSKACKPYGEFDLYVGDDGKVYGS